MTKSKKKSNTNKKSNSKLRVKMKGVSTPSESKATFGGSGAIDAPLAIDMSRPVISQKFKSPSRKGSEGRVTGVDFVGTVDSTTSYSVTTYTINARNSSLFPRLSAIAGVWRRYVPTKMKFHLFAISAATQRGYVSMSSLVTDDLSTLATPSTEAQILNQENVAVGRPWSYCCHTVNLAGMGLKWYSTDTTTSSSEFGEFVGRAFLGIPATTAAADISVQVYVEYDVEFCQRIAGNLVLTNDGLVGGRVYTTGLSSTTNLLLGANLDGSSKQIGFDGLTGNVTLYQPGAYLIGVFITGTGLSGNITMVNTTTQSSTVNTGGTSMTAVLTALNATPETILSSLSVGGASAITNLQFRIALAPIGSLSMQSSMSRIRVQQPITPKFQYDEYYN